MHIGQVYSSIHIYVASMQELSGEYQILLDHLSRHFHTDQHIFTSIYYMKKVESVDMEKCEVQDSSNVTLRDCLMSYNGGYEKTLRVKAGTEPK